LRLDTVTTYSVMRIAVMGPKKMVYPPRKARNFCAEARIFHYKFKVSKGKLRLTPLRHTGTQAHAPMKAARI
jgi:hypothetical protein